MRGYEESAVIHGQPLRIAAIHNRAEAGLVPERLRVSGTFVGSVGELLLLSLVATAEIDAESTVTVI